MSASHIGEFEAAVQTHGGTVTRTDAEGFDAALADALVDPAVGVPLPFEDISLPDDVTTEPTGQQLLDATTGVTAASLGIAAYGTLTIQSDAAGTEPVSLYPPRHVAVLRERDIVAGMNEAIDWLADEFAAGRNTAILATGPSATGDMGALVRGVHGPAEVHVLVVTER